MSEGGSKSDYLKKYLSKDDGKKKKKKTKVDTSAPNLRMKIVEDDAFIAVAAANTLIGSDDEDDESDRPIVRLLNADTESLKMMGKFKANTFIPISEDKNIEQLDDDDDDLPPRTRPEPASRTSTSTTNDSTNNKHLRNVAELDDDPVIDRKKKDRSRVSKDAQRRKQPNDAQKEREKEKQAELQAKYAVWNKGVKQKEERAEKLDEMARVAAEPFARAADDVAMNAHLRTVELADDPMLAYMRSKKVKKQMMHGLVYPKYNGPAPAPNRFGIAPGHRWDGVDRSNGFEAKLFTTSNNRRANEDSAYSWSTGMFE